MGLSTGITSGKAAFNSRERPKFIEALMARISFKPLIVRCSLRSIKLIALLNNKKSAPFWEINGNLSKQFKITLISFSDEALYLIENLLWLSIPPTLLKKSLIFSNKARSITCCTIANSYFTLYLHLDWFYYL